MQPYATLPIVLASAAIAAVNAAGEEILWRGTYVRVFPGRRLLGHIYPALGFGVWHLAPQRVFPNPHPGGALSFVFVASLWGLLYGWVAQRTGSIRWTTLSHCLLDLSGLGATIYFGGGGMKVGRGAQTRTGDLVVPNHAR